MFISNGNGENDFDIGLYNDVMEAGIGIGRDKWELNQFIPEFISMFLEEFVNTPPPEGFKMKDRSKRFKPRVAFNSAPTNSSSEMDIFLSPINVAGDIADNKGILSDVDDLNVGWIELLRRTMCDVKPSKFDILIVSGISILNFFKQLLLHYCIVLFIFV